MFLGTTYSPTVLMGGAAIYKLRLVFTYSNGYWEVYRRFHRDFFLVWEWGGEVEGDCVGGSFHGGFVMGEDNFNEGGGGFSSIIKKQ